MTEYPQLGSYQLLYEVGYGGMGCVFLAERTEPGRVGERVAIKKIHPHLARKAAFVDMFLDEARVAGAMSHANVAQVFDLGRADETYFFAMEYLHGENVGALRAKLGQVSEPHVAHIARLAARGLQHAHELRGDDGTLLDLVHRDISPQNIFVTYDGQVKVTDFGIARAEGRLAQTTDVGRLKGKCAYMAPEQVMSVPLDRRADIFALGVVMWELLTGERLFVSGSDAETLLKIADNDIPPLREYAEVSLGFEAIVMKALAHRREDRFSTAGELAHAIDAHLAGSVEGSKAGLADLMSEHFAEERRDKERSDKEHVERRDAQRQRADTLVDKHGNASANEDADTVMDASVAAASAMQSVAEMDAAARAALPSAGIVEGNVTQPDAARAMKPGAASRSAHHAKLAWGALLVTVAAVVFLAVMGWGARSAPVSSGTVRVASVPSGAVVQLDGEDGTLTTPVILSDLALGRHRLVLTLPNFEAMEVSFDVDRARMDLEYRLSPQDPAALSESFDAPR